MNPSPTKSETLLLDEYTKAKDLQIIVNGNAANLHLFHQYDKSTIGGESPDEQVINEASDSLDSVAPQCRIPKLDPSQSFQLERKCMPQPLNWNVLPDLNAARLAKFGITVDSVEIDDLSRSGHDHLQGVGASSSRRRKKRAHSVQIHLGLERQWRHERILFAWGEPWLGFEVKRAVSDCLHGWHSRIEVGR